MKVQGLSDEQLEKELKKTLRVRAIGDPEKFVGYYNHVRRRAGDVFLLRPIVRQRTTIVLDKNDRPVMVYDVGLKRDVPKKETKTTIITAEMQFSEKWMEKIKSNTPETKPVHFNKTNAGKGTLQNKLNIPGMTSKIGDGFDDVDDVNAEEPTSQSSDAAVI